jgi:hypothetical protein
VTTEDGDSLPRHILIMNERETRLCRDCTPRQTARGSILPGP